MRLIVIFCLLFSATLYGEEGKDQHSKKLPSPKVEYEPSKAKKFRKKLRVEPKGCEYAKGKPCPMRKVDEQKESNK